MTKEIASDHNAISTDVLSGAAAIAVYIGKTERQTQHLIEQRQLPAFKLGNIWHMRKSGYAAFLERLEAAAMPSTPTVLRMRTRMVTKAR